MAAPVSAASEPRASGSARSRCSSAAREETAVGANGGRSSAGAERLGAREPELVGNGGAGIRSVHGDEERRLVPEDEVAGGGGEALDRPDHAHGHRSAWKAQGQDSSRPCGGGDARSRDHRGWRRVGRLRRLEARVRGFVGEQEAQRRALGPHTVEPDPARVVGEHGWPGPERPEREHAVEAREIAVALDRERARELERDDPSAPRGLRNRAAEHSAAAGRGAETDPREEAVRVEDDRGEGDGAAAKRVLELERSRAGRDLRATQRRCRGRLDAVHDLPPRERREAVAPAVERRDRIGRNAENRELPDVARARRPAEDGGHVRAERLVARDRSGLERRDEPRGREVLAHREVARHGVRGLLGDPVVERRAVDDREEPQSQARHQERDGDGGPPRAAGEGERREPHVDPTAAGGALEETQAGDEEAGRGDRDDEGDEAGQEQEQRSRPAALAERARVGVAAREGEDDGEERAERRGVESGEGASSQRQRRHAQDDDEDERCGECEPGHGRETRPASAE